MKITTKQFQLLTDCSRAWDFLTQIYDRERGGGPAAPFFEYAVTSSWMDTTYLYTSRFWLDGEKTVAFVSSESPVTDIYFWIRPGYEFLAGEMQDYAMDHMPDFGGRQRFMLFNGQEYMMKEAEKRGFTLQYDYEDRIFDFENELNRELPAGFTFVDPKKADPVKLAKCLWYGFDHGTDKGPFKDWDREDDGPAWTPSKGYKGVLSHMMSPPPHATPEYAVIIADSEGEYACYSGMWWVPQNHLAYMEPLCTVPEHRGKGLASAALTRHYRTLKPLGATHMTGGGDPFYEKIGYGKGLHWYVYKRNV
ncbi:MAG: hypothetical protein CW338_06905 [Clostridiales bacterium]|nr:hypothetical protein [Clostridiales bacterium]